MGNANKCTIGIDVGGTNTDAVLLRDGQVLAWHKTPTTSDIQAGVEQAIHTVIGKASIPSTSIGTVKIGTTQFVNAVLEQDDCKLDRVAVIRLCGPYSQGSPPFAEFPTGLRNLLEGHVGYVDGGYQVDGRPIRQVDQAQLNEQASMIKTKGIRAVVVVGIYSPSNPSQEEDASAYLASVLGGGYDISCSHRIGKLGFLERENASILNASLRRFARHVTRGLQSAVKTLGNCNLYITLNDGTLSAASEAAKHPVRCFSSGPTNSARGAAFLSSKELQTTRFQNAEVLVMDIGGTTTDICALLPSGFPRQSAAFVKIAGVRTNFTIPDVHSIALGGGSIVRENNTRPTVGPDSVGYRLQEAALCFGGKTLTATDLVRLEDSTGLLRPDIRQGALSEIQRMLERSIDHAKTKAGDAIVILVGGGSIILPSELSGVSNLIRPEHLEVANAVGAAIAKVSGAVDTVVVPGKKTIEEHIKDAEELAGQRCVAAGGDAATVEVVEIDSVPISYVTNGATRVTVRVVADLNDTFVGDIAEHTDESALDRDGERKVEDVVFQTDREASHKASTYAEDKPVDVETYQPDIRGDLWYLSKIDLDFLLDGTGVLGVGSCGEPYPSYIACLQQLHAGKPITIHRQSTISDSSVIVGGGFMGSPTVYLERIPGLDEIINAIGAVLKGSNTPRIDYMIPNEIGGINAFEALLASSRLGKSVLDTDAVARAYPLLWQTVRCLNGVSIAPCSVADGEGQSTVLQTQDSFEHAELVMRDACTALGSLAGLCVNPMLGLEAKTLPQNTFSWAWSIGRTIAIARRRKVNPVHKLIEEHNGALLFVGKIISVTRRVAQGFTRGTTVFQALDEERTSDDSGKAQLTIEFENENLSAVLSEEGKDEKLLAVCPDLITVLDKANGAPLGVSDYRYGLRVSVIALKASPVWTSEKGLEMGGPKAFGLDVPYVSVGSGVYKAPKSVWEMF
ncbi:DUF917-domain-containing protein [Periconia macrospinosa]|uniref:DUF917-domain-containing protein n=1 Tax=Periconia macrospinosa TaxID=97972 RepID=A0A2V1DC48_9PLEO|nr:DUF917-domain-containing protein [Periconia macrospinosa]